MKKQTQTQIKTKNNKGNQNNCKTCAICLINIRNINNKNIIIQNCCKQQFHKKCINKWYKIKKECPLCRKKPELFSDEEKEFLSSTLLNLVPFVRPIYRTYELDSTMEDLTTIISLCQNNIDDYRNLYNENEELNDTLNGLNGVRNFINTIRNVMNN
mgnify:FL=1